jgi:hypothetical protein
MMALVRDGETASAMGLSIFSSIFCFKFSLNDLFAGFVTLPTRSFEAKERLNMLAEEQNRLNERQKKEFKGAEWLAREFL